MRFPRSTQPYFKITGWGWYYLLTLLDDFSRYIIAWKLSRTMRTSDVTELLDTAIERTGVDHVPVRHRPRLLSDNGPSFVSGELREYMQERELTHIRGRPFHPQTQGKIERYHLTMKSVVKLKNYYVPWELKQEIEGFVRHYNTERVHESLRNMTPEDVYLGRDREIQTARDRLKQQTLRRRKHYNQGKPMREETMIRPSLFREAVS